MKMSRRYITAAETPFPSTHNDETSPDMSESESCVSSCDWLPEMGATSSTSNKAQNCAAEGGNNKRVWGGKGEWNQTREDETLADGWPKH